MGGALTGTVLVVDDNAENRALARETLEDEGFVVQLAISGQEAIESLKRTSADCVLLDVRMPGMDGVSVCKHIRELPGGMDVPVLFVTAQRDVDTFDRAREAGGDDFITKPYRPNELVARVTAAIKLRRMAMERKDLVELIRTQRDDVMRLQLQKEQLVAFLVHDLKNPVNAIVLQGQRVLRDPSATERSRDAATRIGLETQSLLRMLLNLLDLSKADESRLAPARQPFDLCELLHDIAANMRPRAQAASVTIEVQCSEIAISADPQLARRILENLVDNAIRYAPEDSAIRVIAERVPDAIALRIADAGSGIPPELRETVFERFVQAKSGANQSSRIGHGLGLAFCKLAVEAHGGRIWIEDGAPGTVFCLRFPQA